jgi:hypothetical protein
MLFELFTSSTYKDEFPTRGKNMKLTLEFLCAIPETQKIIYRHNIYGLKKEKDYESYA